MHLRNADAICSGVWVPCPSFSLPICHHHVSSLEEEAGKEEREDKTKKKSNGKGIIYFQSFYLLLNPP